MIGLKSAAMFWLLLALFVVPLPLFAQMDEEIEVANFSAEDYALRECSFDKAAPAIILLDWGKSSPGNNNELITTRIIRMKILSDAGADFANIKIPYYSEGEFEHISNITGTVVNLTPGNQRETHVLDKKNIYRNKINNRVSEVAFALPGVKKGSLIEYRYTSTMKHYGGLEDWEFQSYLPTLRSCYTLLLLSNSEFVYQVQKKDSLPIIVKPDNNNGRVYFEMNQIAALKEEPYMDSRRDFVQKVSFQLSAFANSMGRSKYLNSWDDVSKEILNHQAIGLQLNKRLDGAKNILQVIELTHPRKEDQLLSIFNYVRNEIQWNGYHGKYAGDGGVKGAWSSKKGNAADVNLILISLLEESGFEVKPLLVAQREYKKVNTSYPFLDQFNKIAARVSLNGKVYVLDATDKITPFGMLPESLLNTTAFLVDKKKGSLILLEQPGEGFRNNYNIVAKVGPDLIFSGKSSVLSYNYSALERMAIASRGDESFIRNVVVKAYTSLQVDSLKLERYITPDTTLLKQFFVFKTPLEVSGDYLLLNPMPLSGIGPNPFTDENRFSDINFGAERLFSFNYHVTLDSSLQVESIPKSLRLKLPGEEIEFTRRVVQENNVLFINVFLRLKQAYYQSEEYSFLRSFYKQMYEYLDEQIVLKKRY